MRPCPRRLRARTSLGSGGGDRTGNDRFCEQFVPLADDVDSEHLGELREEGLIE